jgi:tartrate-resistant acid phosphatase type 5
VLPAFLREPPPLFEVAPRDRPVRFVAFGDFGRGGEAQHRVADAIARYHARDPLDFGITLGDNFYPAGVTSPSDPLWRSLWSELYDRLHFPFYASLGNHDWGRADSPAAEVLFTRPGASWQMPATRYTFRAGAAQLFALDTTALSAAQLAWLDAELQRSDARWKIVYGHHPMRESSPRGDADRVVDLLLPILAGRAQLYLAGHDHYIERLAAERGIEQFVVGSGGAELRPVNPDPRSLFSSSSYGFAVVRVSDEKLAVDLLDTDLNVLHSAQWAKDSAAD